MKKDAKDKEAFRRIGKGLSLHNRGRDAGDEGTSTDSLTYSGIGQLVELKDAEVRRLVELSKNRGLAKGILGFAYQMAEKNRHVSSRELFDSFPLKPTKQTERYEVYRSVTEGTAEKPDLIEKLHQWDMSKKTGGRRSISFKAFANRYFPLRFTRP